MLTLAILPCLRDYRFSFFYRQSFGAVFYLLPLALTFFSWSFSFRQAFQLRIYPLTYRREPLRSFQPS